MHKIQNYQVTDERLGSGGIGVVYKAYRRFDGLDRQTQAACKVIRADLSSDSHYEEMFLQEAFTAMGLAHPNIIQVYDCMRADNRLYLMMEYVDGSSLEELVFHHGPLPESVVAHVVHSVARALAYLHSEGISHGDIAPPNILISKRGRVKISDLGLARSDDNSTSVHDLKGRFAFACPGRLHTGQHTRQSDLWALLATAFYAASGYLPYGPDAQDADHTQAGFDEVLERIASLEIAKPDCEFSAVFDELLADLQVIPAAKRHLQSAADIAAFIEAHFATQMDSKEIAQMVVMTDGPLDTERQSLKRKPAPRRRRLPNTVTGAIAPGMVSRGRYGSLGRLLVLLVLCFSLVLCVERVVFNTGSGEQFTDLTTPTADWRLEAATACYLETANEPDNQASRAVSFNSQSNPEKRQEPSNSERRQESTRAAKRGTSTKATRHKQRAKKRRKARSGVIVLRGRSIPLRADKGDSP
ncbi:MAG: serine/threonine protein kinase [Proteobacteria bacterium]|nr:serine/threonine protein kinase [Pseudomonadota bacterium]